MVVSCEPIANCGHTFSFFFSRAVIGHATWGQDWPIELSKCAIRLKQFDYFNALLMLSIGGKATNQVRVYLSLESDASYLILYWGPKQNSGKFAHILR
jgi:hypothetical protein